MATAAQCITMKLIGALALLAAGTAMAQDASEWNFVATLNGNPIGTHRFVVTGTAAARSVDSQAQLLVRVLGVPVYRYGHRAQERWQGDCLRALRADTDDDGRRQQVEQRYESECLMSFAYWNPRVVAQQRLIDPQTGRIEPVRIERLPDAAIDVGGRPVPALGWRLQTQAQRISVWYAADGGRWIALDAEVKGGGTLRYPPAALHAEQGDAVKGDAMTSTRRPLIASYLLALVFFLALDACWLSLMGPRLYQPALGALMAAEVNWLAAVLFYLIYIGGLLHFAVLPALGARRPGIALCRGALLGLVAYATYDLTNQATLRGWPWTITLLDPAWGATVSGTAAWAAARITCRPALRRNPR